MAELIWKGKTLPHTDTPPTPFTTRYLHNVDGNAYTLPARHDDDTWYNRLIHAPKNVTLPALLAEFASAVDLIYIDPPFMTGRTFKNGSQIRSTSPISYHDTWNNDLDSFLQWLYETFYYLYELLAPDGCLYVHLDWRAAHYAKLLLDEIFHSPLHTNGAGFKNEIVWHYQSGGRAQKSFARKHDSILLYTKSHQYC